MARPNLRQKRRPLLRHHLESEGRRAWSQATDDERRAYRRYLDGGLEAVHVGHNEEIPLSFAIFLLRYRRAG